MIGTSNHRVAIVAHTKRAEQAHQLMADTGATYLTIDNGTLKCEGNHRKAWTWMAQHNKRQWTVVLEDDAVPCENFRDQLEQALEAAPTPIVSLYLGRQRPPHWQTEIQTATQLADTLDANYITATHLLHAVGIAIHTNLIPDMLNHTHNTTRPWDYAIAAWALHNQHTITYTWPSLINHQDGEPVITQHPDKMPRPPGRIAWRHGTRNTWTNTTVQLNPKYAWID